MRSICWFLPAVMCIAVGAQNAGPDRTPDTTIYITHVTVIDTETGKEATDRTVIVAGNKISDVRDSATTTEPVSAKVVDGRGKYLIPGLWDMHVHTWDYESTYPLYVANGVTGVRDMFGPPDANKFRAELAKTQIIAPHFYLASPIVDGHPPVWPESIEVTTPEQGRRVVDEQQKKGADFIKVYSRLAPDAYLSIAAESARVGIPFEGHVPLQVSAWDASDAKQKSFEHLYGIAMACSARESELQPKMVPTVPRKEREAITAEAARSYSETKCTDLFARLKSNGNWQTPTLTVLRSFGMLNDPQFVHDQRLRYFSKSYRDWLDPKDDFRFKNWTTDDFAVERSLFEFSKKVVGAMFRAGVPLLAGTDTGNPFCFPGFSLHDELALLGQSGLTPLAALQAATRNPAIFMNATDRYGSISVGKIADLVLLDADPLQDIHNTSKISEVFLDGREFDRRALDGLLASAERAASQISPSPEMQKILASQVGTWSQHEERPDGTTGDGEVTWRPGPGGMSLVENEFIKSSTGELSGLSVTWYDQDAKGYRAIWCSNQTKNGCLVMSKLAHWEGDQFVLRDEFESNGKKVAYKEVESGITPTTYTLTSYIGEPGGELRPTSIIHATKISDKNANASNAPAEAELRAFMAELRKASIEGDVGAIANSMTDDYVQTDINGYRQDKTTWLNEYFKPLADLIKAGKFHWDEYERKNLEFRFYGACAIVTGDLQLKGTGAKPGPQHTWVADPNATLSGTLHFTHVYIKRDGKWMLAALHNQIPPSPASAAK